MFQDRPKGGVTPQKAVYAQAHDSVDTLEEVVRIIKPSCIIGRLKRAHHTSVILFL